MRIFCLSIRKRPEAKVSKEEMEEEYFLKKEWTKFINRQHIVQMEQIKLALKSQENALLELKSDNYDFYNKAIQVKQNKRILP